MSVRTQVPLSLITSSVTPPPSVGDGLVSRAFGRLQRTLAHVLHGPLIRRSLFNQDALLENQGLLRRNPEAHVRAAVLSATYLDLEPAEARHLELVYLIEGADLFTEGRPWTVHYDAGALVLINRGTRVAVGPVTPRLAKRLNAAPGTDWP